MFVDEFPKELCDKYEYDFELFEAWGKELNSIIRYLDGMILKSLKPEENEEVTK